LENCHAVPLRIAYHHAVRGRAMTKIREIFKENLRRERKRHGYSQEHFAELCGLSQNYIAALENGRKYPSAETMQKIANALNLKPYLLIIEDDPNEVSETATNMRLFIEEVRRRMEMDLEECARLFLHMGP
jgi:transcriptional regulator with XRE-family HTH domain